MKFGWIRKNPYWAKLEIKGERCPKCDFPAQHSPNGDWCPWCGYPDNPDGLEGLCIDPSTGEL